MKTWENLKVTDIGNINDGDWILNKNYSKFGVRLLQVGDIGLGKFVDKTNKFISENTASKLNVSIVTPGKDILVARMPDPIGRACIAPFLPYKYIVAVDISILKVDESRFDIRYIMQLLNSKPILSKVQQKSAGATRIRISRTNLESIKLRVPLLSEQTAIANILSTVDEAIQKADEAITKTERIKQAMMQKLLSEGIGHKEFKKTKLGKIPNNWKEFPVKEIFRVETGTTPSTKIKKFWQNGTEIWITPADLNKIGSKIYISDSERKITLEGISKTNLSVVPENSLILSTRAPVGYTAINSRPVTFNQGCKALVHKEGIKTNVEFYYYLFLKIKQYLENISGGSTFKELSKNLLENIRIPLPNYDEQHKIANMLTDFDKKINLLKSRKQIYIRIKQGLMDDLLTGKKRACLPAGRLK